MSFLHYTSYSVGNGLNRRLGAHTDYDQLTLLFQDTVGGLEVHDEEIDTFRPVHQTPGTVVVNMGNLLEKQTNGRWKSAFASSHCAQKLPAWLRQPVTGFPSELPWKIDIKVCWFYFLSHVDFLRHK